MSNENRTLALVQFITNHSLYEEFAPVARKHKGPPAELAENFIDERGLTPLFHAEFAEANTPDAPHNTLRAYDSLPITPDLTPEKARQLQERNWEGLRRIDHHAHQHGTLLGRYIFGYDNQKHYSVYQIIRVTLLHATIQVLQNFLHGDPVNPGWGERVSLPISKVMAELIRRTKIEERLTRQTTNP